MDEFKLDAKFAGIIQKVQTISTGDGAYRITIDIPENCKEQVKKLMDLQGKVCGFAAGEIVAVKEESEDEPSL